MPMITGLETVLIDILFWISMLVFDLTPLKCIRRKVKTEWRRQTQCLFGMYTLNCHTCVLNPQPSPLREGMESADYSSYSINNHPEQ